MYSLYCANVFLLPHQARNVNVIEDHGTKAAVLLPAEHNSAVAGYMDHHAFLLVDHVKLGIVRITIINLYGRNNVTTNSKSSEVHSAKKYNK